MSKPHHYLSHMDRCQHTFKASLNDVLDKLQNSILLRCTFKLQWCAFWKALSVLLFPCLPSSHLNTVTLSHWKGMAGFTDILNILYKYNLVRDPDSILTSVCVCVCVLHSNLTSSSIVQNENKQCWKNSTCQARSVEKQKICFLVDNFSSQLINSENNQKGLVIWNHRTKW